jgi:Tol biopolymer transport system component
VIFKTRTWNAALAAMAAAGLTACSAQRGDAANGDAGLLTPLGDAMAPGTNDDGGAPGDDDGGDAYRPPLDDADVPASDAGPGGPWIAFTSSQSGTFDIYLVHPDGTDLHQVVGSRTALSPAWSPDGTRIAFHSNLGDAGAYEIYVLDVASSAVGLLETGVKGSLQPAWSPDGTQLAFVGTQGLYTVTADGGVAAPLTSGGFRDSSPVWAPDGAVVYFSSNRDDAGGFDVWSVQPDGGMLTQVTTGTGIIGGPAVSPDGKTLAVTQAASSSGAGASTSVSLFDLATATLMPFSSQGDSEPAFSPDGTEVALTTTRYGTGSTSIVIVGIPGATDAFRLTTASGTNGQASYQPRH